MQIKFSDYFYQIFGTSLFFLVVYLLIATTFDIGSVIIVLLFWVPPLLVLPAIVLILFVLISAALFKHYSVSKTASWLVAIIPTLCLFVSDISSQPFSDNPVSNYGGGPLYFGNRSQFGIHSSHVFLFVVVYFFLAIFPIIIGWKGSVINQSNKKKFLICNWIFGLMTIGLILYAIL